MSVSSSTQSHLRLASCGNSTSTQVFNTGLEENLRFKVSRFVISVQSTGPGRPGGEEGTEALSRESRQKQTCFHSATPGQLGPYDGVQGSHDAQT